MLTTLLVTLVAFACFLTAWTVGRPVPEAISPPEAPVFAVIAEVNFDWNREAQVQVAVSAGQQVLAHGGGSMVTDVGIAGGDTVHNGSLVYAVDGLGVWAMTGRTPLYRALKRGDNGKDVRILQRFLSAYLHDDRIRVTGEFDWETDQAVRRWQHKAGLFVDGIVDPSRFVRINGEFTASEVAVSVGAPAPALGAMVAQGVDTLDSFVLTDPAQGDASAGGYAFLASGEVLQVSFDGTEWTPVGDEEALAFAAVFDVPADDGESVAETRDPVRTQGARVVTIDGRLALTTPVAVAGLAPAALVSNPDGSGCVWLADEDGGPEFSTTMSTSDPTDVRDAPTNGHVFEMFTGLRIVGVSLTGSALVDNPELVGRRLLLNPVDFADTSQCR